MSDLDLMVNTNEKSNVRDELRLIAREYRCGWGGARSPEMPYKLLFPAYELFAPFRRKFLN
jgi:hypothetical protein